MTTSISNSSAEALFQETADRAAEPEVKTPACVPLKKTWAARLIIFMLCLALVLSTLAYGTVHYWSLAVFQMAAALIVVFWAIDAWLSRTLRLSLNPLQLPLLGLILLGLIQLLPFGAGSELVAPGLETVRSLSLDPYSTRLVLVQLVSLLIYLSAALAFIDSPRRLRLIVRTIIIFGFSLAIFGLIQSFTSPNRIYWLREATGSTPFGPFINRHHFAGYMELALGLPLGLLFTGAVERDKRLLYGFATAMMAIALVMTESRGGIISLFAEICFLFAMVGFRRKHEGADAVGKSRRVREMFVRASLAFALLLALFAGVVLMGGESALSRFVGTVNSQDPTTGRSHFWSVTLQIIREHPLIGSGLGSFGLAYTRYDTRNGLFRPEQAHNDYLQVLSDAGLVGAVLGLFFIVSLFRMGLARRETNDLWRRGVATGALSGCFAVLVHSFFDFTLHTTSNALLFLVLAALATLNGRVEEADATPRPRHHRRRHHKGNS